MGKAMMPKKGKKIQLLNYKILQCIKKKMYASQIARQLSVKRTTIDYRINRLHAKGLIEMEVYSSCKLYKLTNEGNIYIEKYKMPKTSLPTKKSRLHTLFVKFPILKDNPNAKWDRVNRSFKNWVPKYTTVTFPIGITIKKTPKSVILCFHEFETARNRSFTDFFNWVMRGTNYAYYYLMNKQGIKIDVFNGEVTHQHIGNEEPDMQGDPKIKTTVGLKRKAQSFYPTDIKAKAWFDKSKGPWDWETNDLLYQERLLLMPENVHVIARQLQPAIDLLTQQVNLHLEVQRETLKGKKEDRRIRRETLETLQEIRGLFNARKRTRKAS